ncbi:MAG: DUF1705 domain-containing protein [Azoarcus sp.]|nr:DUF1705 domain-containing protein [Azoarcus sp.]
MRCFFRFLWRFQPIFFQFSIFSLYHKTAAYFFMLVSSITNYLMYNFGVYIDTEMVGNAFDSNTREALDLATFSGIVWVLLTGIIPALLIVFAKIKYQKFGK